MVNIGGFFAMLQLKSDKVSFSEADKLLARLDKSTKEVDKDFGKFIKNSLLGLTAFGAAVLGGAAALTMIQGKTVGVAKMAAMNVEEFTNWSVAMKILGLNSEDLIAGATKLQATFDNLTVGKNRAEFEKIAESLGLMKENVADLQKMSSSDRMAFLISTVASEKNEQKFRAKSNILSEIAGPTAAQAALGIRIRGLTVNGLLNQANSIRATDTSTANRALSFQTTADTVKAQVEELGNRGGVEIGTLLEPLLKDLSQWLKDNKDTIINAFKDIGGVLKQIAEFLAPMLQSMATNMSNNQKEAQIENDPKFKGAMEKFGIGNNNPWTFTFNPEMGDASRTVRKIQEAGGLDKFIPNLSFLKGLDNTTVRTSNQNGVTINVTPVKAVISAAIRKESEVIPGIPMISQNAADAAAEVVMQTLNAGSRK